MTIRTTLNRLRRRWLRRWIWQPVFGEAQGGRLLPHTRISSASVIEHEDKLVLGDDVFIGAFNFIEASGGITIEEGVQITSHSAIVTHSSHRAQRLLGPAYTTWPLAPGSERPGWISGPIHIGAYSFVGPHCLIEANTRIGRGSLVCAGSFVRGEYPDFSILEGRPARVVGDSRRADERALVRFPELQVLYDAWAVAPAPEVFEGPGER
jgi:acetyltransferase-like isoleucine patch superfamily enzyme